MSAVGNGAKWLQGTNYSAPVAFYFELKFNAFNSIEDQAFSEISGLSVEMQVDEIEEGGANCYKHYVPKEYKYAQLTCKRALASQSSKSLSAWMDGILNSDSSVEITPLDATLNLMDADGSPLVSWALQGLFPVKWSLSDFNAVKNELVTETFVFSYKRLFRL